MAFATKPNAKSVKWDSTSLAIILVSILFHEVIGINRDVTPPQVSGCPNTTISAQAPPGQWKTKVEWEEPTAVDESGFTPTVQQSHKPNKSYFYVGESTYVRYFFIDGDFNVAKCQFIVRVTSDSFPDYDITPPILRCPPHKTAIVAPGSSSAKVDYTPAVARDNSGRQVHLFYYPPSGSSFVPGIHTVWVFASDDSYNENYCSFDVVVSDQPNDEPRSCICGSSIGDILGAVFGTLIGILAIEIMIYIVYKRYRNNQHDKSNTVIQNQMAETTGTAQVSRNRYQTNPVTSPQPEASVPSGTRDQPKTNSNDDVTDTSSGYQSLDPATKDREHEYMSMTDSGYEQTDDTNEKQQEDDGYMKPMNNNTDDDGYLELIP